jgi:hypothetical protein
MIPAIGTCLFVIYLYKSLNQESTDGVAGTATDSPTARELSARLQQLEARIQSLILIEREKSV